MATGGGKPWGMKAFFGTVINVEDSGEVTVGFPADEKSDLKVGDGVVLVALSSAPEHSSGGNAEQKDS